MSRLRLQEGALMAAKRHRKDRRGRAGSRGRGGGRGGLLHHGGSERRGSSAPSRASVTRLFAAHFNAEAGEHRGLWESRAARRALCAPCGAAAAEESARQPLGETSAEEAGGGARCRSTPASQRRSLPRRPSEAEEAGRRRSFTGNARPLKTTSSRRLVQPSVCQRGKPQTRGDQLGRPQAARGEEKDPACDLALTSDL